MPRSRARVRRDYGKPVKNRVRKLTMKRAPPNKTTYDRLGTQPDTRGEAISDWTGPWLVHRQVPFISDGVSEPLGTALPRPSAHHAIFQLREYQAAKQPSQRAPQPQPQQGGQGLWDSRRPNKFRQRPSCRGGGIEPRPFPQPQGRPHSTAPPSCHNHTAHGDWSPRHPPSSSPASSPSCSSPRPRGRPASPTGRRPS